MAPVEQVLPPLEILVKLVDEPALADAGDADEGDELRLPLALDARERLADQGELALPADELRAVLALDADARPRAERLPDGDWLGLALRLDCIRLDVLDRALGCTEGRLVDEHPVDRRGGLQARGVDDVPGRNALTVGRAGAGGAPLPGPSAPPAP